MFGQGFGFVNPTRHVDNHNSAAGDAAAQLKVSALDSKATQHALYSMRQAALVIVLMLIDAITEDTLGDELPSEFLDNQMQEAIGDMGDEKSAAEWLKNMLAAHIADVLESLGASEDLITDAFGDDVDTADSALETIAETVLANLPADGDEINQWAKAFVYGDDTEDMHNALTVGKTTTKKDAKGNTLVYKAVKAMKNGQPIIKNKRVSGNPYRTPAQQASLKKAQSKAHTESAVKQAQKSIAKGNKMGLYKSSMPST